MADEKKMVTIDAEALAEIMRASLAPKPLTPAQIAERERAAIADGEASQIRAATAKVAELGLPSPVPGTKLVVRCAKTKGRRRAGIDFTDAPTTLEVVAGSTAEAKAGRVDNGSGPVSVEEALIILADDSLATSLILTEKPKAKG